MRTLYLECRMGAAGDMLTAALLELLDDPDAFVAELNALGIPGVEVTAEPATRAGVVGTRVRVRVHGHEEACDDPGRPVGGVPVPGPAEPYADDAGHDHGQGDHRPGANRAEPGDGDHEHGDRGGHAHGDPAHGHAHHVPDVADHDHVHPGGGHGRGLADIEQVVGRLALPEAVRRDVLAVYGLVVAAEARAHGVPVAQVHLHEVGALDAVADITAVCLLVHRLAPDQVVVSPVHVGSGHVRCAHGVLPVPAPATAEILRGVPVYGGAVDGELCTPTGAALLKHFAHRFGDLPVMRVEAIGYGMGAKRLPVANCLRAMLGDAEPADPPAPGTTALGEVAGERAAASSPELAAGPGEGGDVVTELRCNLDDMTGEAIAHAADLLREAGALEVWTVAVGMKKSRPGTMLCLLCREADEPAFTRLLLQHTTTLGVRAATWRRRTLDRTTRTVSTPYGDVRVKVATGHKVARTKPEHDDLARIARERGLPLEVVRQQVLDAVRE